jgi:hypothetical protein
VSHSAAVPNLVLITLVPGQGTDPTQLTNYLADLSITAYDASVHNTSTPTLLGTADQVAIAGDLLTVTQQSATTNASIMPNILQHYNTTTFLGVPPVYTPLSVATDVIVANMDPTTNPQPNPEYPTPTSYDLLLKVTCNCVDLCSDTINWNAAINTVNSVLPQQTDYFNMTFTLFDIDLANLSTSTFFALLPPLHTADAAGASSLTLNSKIQPPPLSDLVNTINAVLAMDAPAGDGSLGAMGNTSTTTNVLTTAQCAAIAAEIIYNRAVVPLPAPDLPSGVSLEQLFTLPTPSNSNCDQTIQKSTGSLTAHYATNSSNAQRLAGYIYAASAAVYAEEQTSDAIFANLTFPIYSSLRTATPNSSASVLLSGVSSGGAGSTPNALNPSFVVPAAYFCALGYAYPVQLSPAQQYKAILITATDNLATSLQAAVDAGILGTQPTALALVTAGTTLASNNNTMVNSAQALRRLVALGVPTAMSATAIVNATAANSASAVNSTAPVPNPLIGSVADIAGLWPQTQDISDAAFWLKETSSSDYLNLILPCIAHGNTTLVSDKFFAVSFAPSTTQAATAGSIPVLSTNTPSDLFCHFPATVSGLTHRST